MRVAAYAVIVDDDQRILLSHWIEGRRPAWTMPGGGLEPGEDPERAVKREVREETGYRALVGELPGIHSRVIPPGRRIPDGATEPLHTLRIVYRATIVGGRLRNEIDGSTDRADWFPLATVRSLQRVRLVDIALRLAKVSY